MLTSYPKSNIAFVFFFINFLILAILHSVDIVGWRDSPEFVLSSALLDISHPAGFPLFAVLGNLFSLIPIGPLVWRVNLLCLLSASVVTTLSWCLAYQIIRCASGLNRPWCALVAPVVLMCSTGFWRQSQVAEVYLVNASLLLAQLNIFLLYWKNRDYRLILVIVLLAALAAANHASSVLGSALIFLALFANNRDIRSLVLPAIFGIVLTAQLYCYIPVRAANTPPLNTGGAASVARFLALLTDQRDRLLKQAPASLPTAKTRPPAIVQEAKNLAGDTSWFICSLTLLGFGIMARRAPHPTLLLSAVIGTNLAFFWGWDSDPRTLQIVFLGVCVSMFSSWLFTFSQLRLGRRLAYALPTIVVFPLVYLGVTKALAFRADIQSANLSKSTYFARHLLENAPRHSALLTEVDWFFVNYLQKIEGLRPDVALVYQPRLLFPKIFEAQLLELTPGRADRFDSSALLTSDLPADQQDLQLFSNFLRWASARMPLVLQPSLITQPYIKEVAQVDARGVLTLHQGQSAKLDPNSLESLKNLLREFSAAPGYCGSQYYRDARQHLESQLINYAGVFAAAGDAASAIGLYAAVCTAQKERQIVLTYGDRMTQFFGIMRNTTEPCLCSPTAIGNLEVYQKISPS